MKEYICELCGKDFEQSRAASAHRSKCSGSGNSADRLRSVRASNDARRKQELKAREETQDYDFSFHQDDHGTPAALFDEPLELPAGSKRKRRLPKRFTDLVPSTSNAAVLPTTSLPHFLDFVPPPPVHNEPEVEPTSEIPDLNDSEPFTTSITDYGLYRVYPSKPRDDPDDNLVLEDLCDSPDLAIPEKDENNPSLPEMISNKYFPFANAANFIFAHWQNNGATNKSDDQMNLLAQELSTNPDVLLQDLRAYNAKRERNRINSGMTTKITTGDGWREGTVKIRMPAEDKIKRTRGEARAPELEVSGIQYRPLLKTLHAALDDPNAPPMHYTPYKEYWKPFPNSTPERVFGELYSSDSWLEAHDEVQKLPKGHEIDNFVLPIILYSDSTHLANFGTASLWPLYCYLGGVSKYVRCKPTEAVCHHLAYIPSLPGNVQDVYNKNYGRTASSELLTHLKRELMQAVLRLVLLQEDVIDAYKKGFLFDCSDGITRRLFPRFMIYSADYPERTLVATIRNLGAFPCPSCLTPLNEVHCVGTGLDKENRENTRIDDAYKQSKIDRARKLIFDEGFAVEAKKIKDILNEGSLIPIENAFTVLAPFNFNYYDLFGPDLMHEVELGVWKFIFTQLMRLLVAVGGDAPATLYSRYRLVPTFGRDTIRRFPKNAGGMQKLAARDFEDLLQWILTYAPQCSLPAFESLFPPEHDEIVSDLLFIMATWHALAKLRIHTDTTVRLLEDETKRLGKKIRAFKDETCEVYDTRELPKEIAARGRRESAMIAKGKPMTKSEKAKRKKLNINTPKFHAMGGYAFTICRKGTTDNSSTQVGEMQHKRVKRLYAMTNKRNTARDVSKLEEQQRLLNCMRTKLEDRTNGLPKTAPEIHYHMGQSKKDSIHLPSWIEENRNDPALLNFVEDIHLHILSRLLSRNESDTFTLEEFNGLHIKKDRLYRLKILRVNYTTYDLRRTTDTINSSTHPDVMLLSGSSETDHPYYYARVVGLFHADVAYTGPGSSCRDFKRMDIVWARFFQLDSSFSFGFDAKRLPRLTFLHHSDSGAFGFLDPELIIRSAHLIPSFAFGKTGEYLPRSLGRPLLSRPDGNDDGDDNEDYKYYFVNIFVDRDTFMRHRGGGIGHKMTWALNETLLRCDYTTEELLEEDGQQLLRSVGEKDEDYEQSTDDEVQSEKSDQNGEESDGYAEM